MPHSLIEIKIYFFIFIIIFYDFFQKYSLLNFLQNYIDVGISNGGSITTTI
jgi:hypothetical protein